MRDPVYGPWLPPAASAEGPAIDRLLWIVHGFMLLLFVAYGAVFVWWLLEYRERKETRPATPTLSARGPRAVELVIVFVELLLLFGLSIPLWARLRGSEPAGALTVRVVAEQFAWNLHYAGPDGRFGRTDLAQATPENPLGADAKDPAGRDDVIALNQLHLPLGRPVIIELSSKDVVHSFNIQVFRVKQDAIPGQRTRIWFTPTQAGHFELVCAQLCGLGHYRMRAEVVVEPPDEFERWLRASAQGSP